jgi:hypothetical protein
MSRIVPPAALLPEPLEPAADSLAQCLGVFAVRGCGGCLGPRPRAREVRLEHRAARRGQPGLHAQRQIIRVDQTHPKVHALYESWGWQTLGDLRPRLSDAALFHAMLLPLQDR